MRSHRETRVLPYSAAQVYDVVADVKNYPEFLPWCTAARIKPIDETTFEADVAIGFKMVREVFSSRVQLQPSHQVDVVYLKGPFKTLTNRWHFREHPKGMEVEFFLEFEFRSRVLEKLIGLLFEEAVSKMVAAFEGRAKQLYG